jgi:flagellar hook-length control protein FliK
MQCDKAGSASPEPFSKPKSSGSSRGGKQESFLATLRKVSPDRNPSERSRQSASTATAKARSEKTDPPPKDEQGGDNAPVDDDNLKDIISLLGNDEASLNDETQLAADNGHDPSASKKDIHLDQLPGQESVASIKGILAGEGVGAEKPVEMLAAMTRPMVETETVSKEPASMKTVENSPIPLQSENPEKADPAKPNRDVRAAAELMVANNGPAEENETEMAGKAGEANRNGPFSRMPAAAEGGQRSGSEPLQENSLTGDSSPISKFINDLQGNKENPLKVDPGLADDAGSKVVKLEAGTHDSGQLTSQSQTFDKALESASGPKEAEAAQRAFRTSTMEQIVRRAVIQVRDGQHEARIDLKPEFLGHVRMQVITENQQVTVKILTEFGFVKEMIENNIQQLKADLQQQGLEVDKLDVSVSRDANGNKQQESTEHAKNLQHVDKPGDGGDTQEKQREHPERSYLSAEGLSTVDYFA